LKFSANSSLNVVNDKGYFNRIITMVFTGTQNMGSKNDDQTRIIKLDKQPRW